MSTAAPQGNAVPFLVSFLIIASILTLKSNYHTLGLSLCLNPILRRLGWLTLVDPGDQAGKVSFPVAIRSKLLWGPSSYSLADNPHYADAFSMRHWNPSVRQRLRAAGNHGSQYSRHQSVTSAGLDDDADDDNTLVDRVVIDDPQWASADIHALEDASETNISSVPALPAGMLDSAADLQEIEAPIERQARVPTCE